MIIRKDAKHCPACGEELFIISVFPFKIYFSRTAAFFFAFPLFLLGMFLAFDTPGCISGCNQQADMQAAEQMDSFPLYWRDVYQSLTAIYWTNRWSAVKKQFKETPDHSLPRLNGEQLAMVIGLFGSGDRADAYALLHRVMKGELQNDLQRSDTTTD